MPTPEQFVLASTALSTVEYLPELKLHLAPDVFALWERTEREQGGGIAPPPFWAFAWAGGQALARHILDHPETVAGKRVLDLAAGCGVVAVAAARSGAARVTANDIDGYALAAIALNATANGVAVRVEAGDLLDSDPLSGKVVGPVTGAGPMWPVDVVLTGDVCYSAEMTRRILAYLSRARSGGAEVLIGDPGRAYLPRERLVALSTHDIPVTRDLEDADTKRGTVWSLTG